MNVVTGEILRGEAFLAAVERGEVEVVEVSEHVAKTMEVGKRTLNRKQRRAEARRQRLDSNKK